MKRRPIDVVVIDGDKWDELKKLVDCVCQPFRDGVCKGDFAEDIDDIISEVER